MKNITNLHILNLNSVYTYRLSSMVRVLELLAGQAEWFALNGVFSAGHQPRGLRENLYFQREMNCQFGIVQSGSPLEQSWRLWTKDRIDLLDALEEDQKLLTSPPKHSSHCPSLEIGGSLRLLNAIRAGSD